MTPAVHLAVVVLVVATYWTTALDSEVVGANIGAAFVLLVLAVLASPWSWLVELSWPHRNAEVAAVLYSIAAIVNVGLHGFVLLAVRRSAPVDRRP